MCVRAQVWEGLGAVKTGRVMLGATNPADSAPGTIRGDFAVHVGRNICHGARALCDSVVSCLPANIACSISAPEL